MSDRGPTCLSDQNFRRIWVRSHHRLNIKGPEPLVTQDGCWDQVWTSLRQSYLDLLDVFGHHLSNILSKCCQPGVSDGVRGPGGGCMKHRDLQWTLQRLLNFSILLIKNTLVCWSDTWEHELELHHISGSAILLDSVLTTGFSGGALRSDLLLETRTPHSWEKSTRQKFTIKPETKSNLKPNQTKSSLNRLSNRRSRASRIKTKALWFFHINKVKKRKVDLNSFVTKKKFPSSAG